MSEYYQLSIEKTPYNLRKPSGPWVYILDSVTLNQLRMSSTFFLLGWFYLLLKKRNEMQ